MRSYGGLLEPKGSNLTPLKSTFNAEHFIYRSIDTVKYLGIYLIAANKWKVAVDHVKLRFYRVFNCIYAQCHSNNSEMITV